MLSGKFKRIFLFGPMANIPNCAPNQGKTGVPLANMFGEDHLYSRENIRLQNTNEISFGVKPPAAVGIWIHVCLLKLSHFVGMSGTELFVTEGYRADYRLNPNCRVETSPEI